MLRGAGGPADAHKRLLEYLKWATLAVQMLASQISDCDLRALLLTRRYELLLSGVGTMRGPEMELQRAVSDLVDLEVNQRVEALESAIKELEVYTDRWKNFGDLLVLDTNFYVVHPTELKDTDLARLTAAVTPGGAMHVLVPLLVVDELDGLRALAVQVLAGRPVTMVTHDKNMAFRARYDGLQAVSPPYPEQEEGQGPGTTGPR